MHDYAFRTVFWITARNELSEILQPRFLRLKALLEISLNNPENAIKLIELAIKFSYENNNLLEVAKSLSVIANTYSDIGFWNKAEYTIKNALEIIESLNSPQSMVVILNNLSFFKLQLGKLIEAENLIEIAKKICTQNEIFETLSSIYQTESSFFRFQFKIEKSKDSIEESIKISNKFKLYQISIINDLHLLEINLIQGKFEECHVRLKDLEFRSRQNFSIIPRVDFHKAQLAFFEKDYESADQLFAAVESSKTRYLQIARARVYRLECARKLNKNVKEREAALEETLARCGHQVLQWDAPIFEMLQENPSQPPKNLETQTPNQALKLEISSLGNRIVRINEQTVKIPLSKSFELLVWLALHGASRRETMIDALWDGANDPRHGEYFKVAMKRLRSALAEHCPEEFNPIKLEGSQYQINPAFEVHFDLKELKIAISSTDLPIMEAGLRQYQGSFMPGLDTTWIDTERNHALEEALNLALRIGKNHYEPQGAALAFEAAIRFDPLCEEAYVQLIGALKASEQPEAAARAYRMYSRMMREELGLEPEMVLDGFPK